MKQFKAESKRLLDLMINSIYTHKEIFMREIISNASDAIDKLYFLSLTNSEVGLQRQDFEIRIVPNEEGRTLTISDNGIGMTKAELEANLGVIASSGSLAFRAESEGSSDVDIIGQFGVGFYSAFMVAKKVTVISRAFGEADAYKWESRGAEGYSVTKAQRDTVGTDIIMVLKDDTEHERYGDFLQQWQLEQLIKKYSDYIRYPIKMDVSRQRKKIGSEDEYETVVEQSVLNSMVPIWKRSKSEVSKEDYDEFYKDKFFDFTAPARVIQSSTEGTATYNALLFIPQNPPHNYYTKEYEKGLQLYASGVLIMDKCSELLPDCFSFVRGLVDSQDVTLNISREMLQHDRQLTLIRTALQRKIRSELSAWMGNARSEYEEFFTSFGLQLKVGAYANYGAEADSLKDLLLFHCAGAEGKTQDAESSPAPEGEDAPAKSSDYISLAEYVAAMPENQPYIYYAAGERDSLQRLAALPQAGLVREKGYSLLLLTEEVDEFVLQVLRNYEGKEFRNISSGELGLDSDEQKQEIEQQTQQHAELLSAMQSALGGRVKQVKLSSRLQNNPVILTAEGALSLEMEKVLNSMPTGEKVESQKVLELNGEHAMFQKLADLHKSQPEKLQSYAELLYNQALLIEGLPIEDPAAYSRLVSELLLGE